MQLIVDLSNPAEIRASIEILGKYLPVDPSGGAIEEQFLDNLWPRLSPPLREIVKAVALYPGPLTIDHLATLLGRPERSIRSSLNSPLARATKSAQQAVPGAPELFMWRTVDGISEMDMTPETRAALVARPVDDTIEQKAHQVGLTVADFTNTFWIKDPEDGFSYQWRLVNIDPSKAEACQAACVYDPDLAYAWFTPAEVKVGLLYTPTNNVEGCDEDH